MSIREGFSKACPEIKTGSYLIRARGNVMRVISTCALGIDVEESFLCGKLTLIRQLDRQHVYDLLHENKMMVL